MKGQNGENICKPYVIRGNIQIWKEPLQPSSKKQNNIVEEWAKGLNGHFSKDIQMANSTWKTLNIANHQENANQTHSRCQDEEKREPCTVGRNVNWCSYCGKQHRGFSRIKNRTTIRSSSPVLGVCVSKSSGVCVLKLQLHSCAAVFIAAVFSRACWGTA